jgi:hypothetical protein
MSPNPIPNRWTRDGHCLGRTVAYNLHSFSKYYEWNLGIIGIINLNKDLFMDHSYDSG